LEILVVHSEVLQIPVTLVRPFFIVTKEGFSMSTFFLQLIQNPEYTSATMTLGGAYISTR